MELSHCTFTTVPFLLFVSLSSICSFLPRNRLASTGTHPYNIHTLSVADIIVIKVTTGAVPTPSRRRRFRALYKSIEFVKYEKLHLNVSFLGRFAAVGLRVLLLFYERDLAEMKHTDVSAPFLAPIESFSSSVLLLCVLSPLKWFSATISSRRDVEKFSVPFVSVTYKS